IMGTFLVQGTLVGVIGTLLGLVMGLLLALQAEPIVSWLEGILATELVSSEVYFLSSLPSEIRVSDVVTICLTAIVLSILSTLYPSWRAARVQPAEALRYD
ncbi:MAG: FtsX-like permease family protein, partial [Pseudomonadota bacterium]